MNLAMDLSNRSFIFLLVLRIQVLKLSYSFDITIVTIFFEVFRSTGFFSAISPWITLPQDFSELEAKRKGD